MRRNSWLTILAATGFNVLFEYSLRGVNHLVAQPLLLPILFTIYFTLFTMLNDLITRFKLRDYHLMVLAFFFGTFYQFFASGAAVLRPSFADVNWTSILFVVVVWWGVVQTVVTFYLANRVAPRDWSWRLPKAGWLAALTLNALMIIILQLSPATPTVNAQQIVVMVVIMSSATVGFILLLPNAGKRVTVSEFHPAKILDALCVATVTIFFISAVFLTFDPTVRTTSLVNFTATRVVTTWTIILALATLAHRLSSKKPIPV